MMIVIEKPATADNGTLVSHHAVRRAEIAPDGDAITLYMASWVDEAARLRGADPIAFSAPRLMIESLPNSSVLIAEMAAALTESGWLAGGVVVSDGAMTVEAAKLRKWASIKNTRSQKEYGGFAWDGSSFDSDALAQSRIQGAVILAMQAAAAEQPFSITWTLSDNSTRVLTGAEMIAVGGALAQHVITLHEVAQDLRVQLDAAETIEDVDSVVWPTEAA